MAAKPAASKNPAADLGYDTLVAELEDDEDSDALIEDVSELGEDEDDMADVVVKDEEEDKHLAFNAGADDYLTKPFSPRELSDRVKAVLRRSNSPSATADEVIVVDDRLQIDFARREVLVDG